MTYTVGDLVAEFLAAAGVTTAFGIVSVHDIPVLHTTGQTATRFLGRGMQARPEGEIEFAALMRKLDGTDDSYRT